MRALARRMVAWQAAVLLVIGLAVAVALPSRPATAEPRHVHTVTFDKYSLMIDGRRTYIWSGEFHYWRLPSPDLWRDVLQKLKADGYNAVSIYFDWGYHSPKPGVYDFTGVRDVDKLLDIADRVGIYVIARPGPYINAETTGGGFPGWLTAQAGRARSDAPDYLAAADEWLHHIDAIIRRHQLTNGTGTVILYQIENELAATGTAQRDYMRNLHDTVRGDGITVPIFHNDKGRNGRWVPSGSDVPGTVPGPVDLYAFDGYPGGSCHTDGSVGSPSPAPDWGIWGPGGATGGASASPHTPGFTAEFGGGWFDYWGSVGTYECMSRREGPGYERVFYGTNIANRLSIQNVYMTVGGTSWGWLPAPVVYTSYDYGAAFSEARQIRPKATTMKELGLFVQSVHPITKVDAGDPVIPSSSAVKVYHDVNPDTGTHFYIATHDPSSATTDDAFTFPIRTGDGAYTLPLRIDGQDAKILVADYDMDGQHLVYSTSEIMTHVRQGNCDVALLYGRKGEAGQTVLRYSSRPTVRVLAGEVRSGYDAATGDLRLDYPHDGLARVRISGGGRPPLTLLLADDATAGTFWRDDTAAGPVLARGPELVRTAAVAHRTLLLTGDTRSASDLEVWAPAQVHDVRWNGREVPVTTTASGSLAAPARLAGTARITLPALSNWRSAPESPESRPSFDDSGWLSADKTTTNSTTPPPAGQPVLTADDYGFHQGDVWYRGHYTGDPAATTLSLRYGGGGAGMLQAWLDGVHLGQDVLASGASSPPTTGTATFTLPAALRTSGPHTLAVMVRNDGHNEDGGVNDAQKEGRGLIAATMRDPAGAVVDMPVDWRVQGNLGGEDIADPARGVMNDGGLYGERHGWHLPGYPDGAWTKAAVPAATAMPGTTWYRTHFDLRIPRVDDASLGLTIGDPSTPRSDADYRALIFVNGWNMGQYVADVGPQHTFVIPDGVLDPSGHNTLAIAVTSAGGAGNGLESVRLTDLGTVRGGVPVALNRAPSWNATTWGTPRVPDRVAVDQVTGDAPNPARPGDTFRVSATIRNDHGPDAHDVDVALDAPSGWTVSPVGSTHLDRLAVGESATMRWTVTAGADASTATYGLSAIATYTQAGEAGQTGGTYSVTVRRPGDHYLSDLPFVSATNGWGPVERDMSNGEQAAGDGRTLSVHGSTYAKGLGTNASSTVVIDLAGTCTSFDSDVGVDDETGGKGSVTFTVLADATTVAQTAVLHGGDPPQHVTADVTGAKQLTLIVGDGGDGNGHDHGDWAGAEVRCTG